MFMHRPRKKAAAAPAAPAIAPRIATSGTRKPRKKKGPKRVKKTAAQLDAEMEDYRAQSDMKA